MATRRSVIKGAVGVAAIGALFPNAVAFEKVSRQSMVGRYFYDENLEFGRRFAQELSRSGVRPIGVRDNWTSVWSRDVDPIWRKQPMAIAGVTHHGPMFMFTQLAQRHGMRLVYQAEIMQRSDECSARVEGLSGMSGACGALDVHSASLPEDVARSFLAVSGASVSRSDRFRSSTGNTPDASEDPVFAWVVAPVAGAAHFV